MALGLLGQESLRGGCEGATDCQDPKGGVIFPLRLTHHPLGSSGATPRNHRVSWRPKSPQGQNLNPECQIGRQWPQSLVWTSQRSNPQATSLRAVTPLGHWASKSCSNLLTHFNGGFIEPVLFGFFDIRWTIEAYKGPSDLCIVFTCAPKSGHSHWTTYSTQPYCKVQHWHCLSILDCVDLWQNNGYSFLRSHRVASRKVTLLQWMKANSGKTKVIILACCQKVRSVHLSNREQHLHIAAKPAAWPCAPWHCSPGRSPFKVGQLG